MQLTAMTTSLRPYYFVFNHQEFHQAIGENKGLGKEIVTIVLSELPTRIGTIQNSVKLSETGVLRREMHDLKGIVGLLGCTRLYQLISELKLNDQAIDPPQRLTLHAILERLKMLENDLIQFSKMELLS